MSRLLAACAAFAATLFLGSSPGNAQRDCTLSSFGLTPLDDLGTAAYQGFQGGLYPGGSNVRPAAHEAAGLFAASRIVPLDTFGVPDSVNGRIVLLTAGMSNVQQESQWLEFFARLDPQRSPAFTVVNGGQPGQSAEDWVVSWPMILARLLQGLANQGLSAEQVQVLWYMQATDTPTEPFPVHARVLESKHEAILTNLQGAFPNLRIGLVGARIYGGYAVDSVNPEPFAYESGFSSKWLIGRQIAGDAALNWDPRKGAVKVPWLCWGPYLWADGTRQRADGVLWECGDFDPDGVHPSFIGAAKVAARIVQFLRTDAVTTSFYLRPVVATSAEPLSQQVPAFAVGAPRPNPFDLELTVPVRLARGTSVRIGVYSTAGRLVRELAAGPVAAGSRDVVWDGRDREGRRVAAGTYLIRVQTGDGTRTVKTTLLR
jgi:hypothetical protein